MSRTTRPFARWTVGAVAACLFQAAGSHSLGAEALQVVDAADVVLGPVVGIHQGSGPAPGYFFAYDQGGKSTLLMTSQPNEITVPSQDAYKLYYTSILCDNTPLVVETLGCCLPPLQPLVIPHVDELWEVDQSQTIEPLVTAWRSVGSSLELGACQVIAPQTVSGHPISLWGTLDFTPPLRVERNPFLFGDDFSSQNLEAWSNQ